MRRAAGTAQAETLNLAYGLDPLGFNLDKCHCCVGAIHHIRFNVGLTAICLTNLALKSMNIRTIMNAHRGIGQHHNKINCTPFNVPSRPSDKTASVFVNLY